MDNFGLSVGTDALSNPGASGFYARVGAPSPENPSNEQLVNSTPSNFWDTIKAATGSALKVVTGNSTAAVAATGVSALGEGVKKAGEGVKAAATSAASGIKWGVAAVVVLGAIILLAQVRRATG